MFGALGSRALGSNLGFLAPVGHLNKSLSSKLRQ